jgi:hypothetical protein
MFGSNTGDETLGAFVRVMLPWSGEGDVSTFALIL